MTVGGWINGGCIGFRCIGRGQISRWRQQLLGEKHWCDHERAVEHEQLLQGRGRLDADDRRAALGSGKSNMASSRVQLRAGSRGI